VKLAIVHPVLTIYANLNLCAARPEESGRVLARLLRLKEQGLLRQFRLHAYQPDDWISSAPEMAIVLKRNVTLGEWAALTNAIARENFGIDTAVATKSEIALLKKLRRKAVFARPGQIRLYPYGNSLAHVLGFMEGSAKGYSIRGAHGVELTFNTELAGVPGTCISEQDAAGDEWPERRQYFVEPVPGNHLTLAIHLPLQQLAEQVLAEAVRRHNPRSASVIIVRPRTGEILAWAVLPNFWPQHPGASPPESWRNPPTNDMIEIGSVFKLITLAAALSEGLLTLDSWIYCENGVWKTKEITIRDHGHRYGWLTVRLCFAKSSNIAFGKIAEMVGPARFYRCITNFGFKQITGICLPGETPGRVEPPSAWKPEQTRCRGFGQSISVSLLQTTMAYCAVGNDGLLMRPLLVNRIASAQGHTVRQFQPQCARRVLAPAVARLLREALKGVVSRGGTGAGLALDDYSLGAKTGTAQKSDATGILKDRHYSSIIGLLPAEAPEVCLAVGFDEPKNGYMAAAVVGPTFRKLAEETARLLNIPADKRQHR
jgi:cell division protein FtsI/penicillin-binding protein 2